MSCNNKSVCWGLMSSPSNFSQKFYRARRISKCKKILTKELRANIYIQLYTYIYSINSQINICLYRVSQSSYQWTVYCNYPLQLCSRGHKNHLPTSTRSEESPAVPDLSVCVLWLVRSQQVAAVRQRKCWFKLMRKTKSCCTSESSLIHSVWINEIYRDL